jgi:CHAT domain-containing protein/Flp pilus assembly protein TadD
MNKSVRYALVAGFFCLSVQAQVNFGGFMKDKADELKNKLKDKAKDKTIELLDKERKEYDESNFNYAISFLDNSGVFEADEKGSGFASSLRSGTKLGNNEEKSTEDRAYTNLKNGELLMAGNKYYLAEQSFKLSKLLYEEDGKTGTGNYAQVISDLGLLYQSRGRFNRAVTFNEQAIKLREAGDNKGMLIVSVNNNGVLKKETGYYAEAESELKRALELSKTEKDVLAQALVHNNIAMTYLDMNKIKDAESEMNQSVASAQGVLKDNSSNYIKLQINLANVYRLEKKYKEAEGIYLKAIAVKEKKLGTHPDLAQLKCGLAQLYMEMGNHAEVEKLLQSAYEIDKQKLGENNPATLAVRQELASFYRFGNNGTKALELISDVVSRKKTIYGETHPNYIQALEDLALTQWLLNKMPECKANYKIVIENTLSYIHTFFNSLNDNEKNLYWEKTNARLQRFGSFAKSGAKADGELLKMYYNVVINTKGFLLNNSVKIRNAIFSGNDEGLKNTYGQWLETKEHLNLAYQLSKDELAQEKINLDSLKNRANELEKELSQKSALFKENMSEVPLSAETLQKQLKAGECAIEIEALDEYNNGFTGQQNYIALVLLPNELRLVELGNGKDIEKAILDFREKTINIKPENEAYALTWKPIDINLKGVTKIYLSLDGAFHQLSINALKDPTGKYLADKYILQFVGNTKDLVEVKASEATMAKPTTAFLAGNPLFGKNELIEQLPGTEKEVKNISALLSSLKVNATVVIGAQATEAKIKSVNSPGILHIATHGYFLADAGKLETTKVLGVDVAAASENPLLRSGLLFAGCENVFDENFKPSLNSENGVLTAYEAMALNLDKTDLVVLSACETGLGSVKQGEGVYGLQRAFLIAGAKSIIMSLWSVSDNATMELMTLFYTNYAKTGNKAQAFSDAMKQLKLKYKDPFYWGAFVMLNK